VPLDFSNSFQVLTEIPAFLVIACHSPGWLTDPFFLELVRHDFAVPRHLALFFVERRSYFAVSARRPDFSISTPVPFSFLNRWCETPEPAASGY
jgi:hypothetical protein